MRYTFNDAIEMIMGCFSASLLFVAVRGGTPGPFVDVKVGLGIFAIWTYMLYKSFIHNNHTSTFKFVMNMFIATIISIAMASVFKLAVWDQLVGINFFSGPGLIIYILSLPTGLLFEKMNIKSNFGTSFVSKKY